MRRMKINPLIRQSFPPPPSSSNNHKPNPTLIVARNLVIVLGVVLLTCVVLHFVLRHLIKKRRRPSNSQQQPSNFGESSNRDHDVAYERQLQQLFTLHDSGLDQAFIDALPVFVYKELVMGLHEPFDCAVCLSEFSQHDKLRLLPLCSHAFHINCIDTWLLSNSTCPLCRGTLVNTEIDELDDVGVYGDFKQFEKRVFPVRLGKFRATKGEEKQEGETSTSTSNSNMNVDGRRCFSMGSYEYVVGKSELQVVFCPDGDVDVDGNKISSKSKGESLSVSKIWLWSNKHQHRFQDSSFNVGLPPTSSNATN